MNPRQFAQHADEAGDAVRSVIRAYHGEPAWRSMVAERLVEAKRNSQHAMLADHLLRHTDTSPEDWNRVNEFLKDNRLTLGDTIGSGQDSVVFEALPSFGDQRYVFKVGYDPKLYELPDVPGVVPYASKGAEGGVAFGVQPRAAKTYADKWRPEGHGHWEWWTDRAHDVEQSLWARGHHWLDYDEGNIGLMPDGTFGVFDGPVRPREGYVPGTGSMTPEEAIRLLRLR